MAKRYGWLGASRKQALAGKLDRIVRTWWDAWGLEPVPGAIDAAVPGVAADRYWLIDQQGLLAVHMDGSLAEALTGIDDKRGGHFADHLSQKALHDLVARLADQRGSVSPISTTEVSSLPAELAEERRGACSFGLSCGPMHLSIWLDRAMADRLAPRTTSNATLRVLASRTDALAPARTQLTARLELGDIAMGELRDLHVGDVLMTRTPLSELIDLVISDSGKHLIHGRLGEQGGQRALLLQAANLSESTT
ncbi:FliM/FliN family flagellar motor C-terminal domain-containing protein [Dyella silvatica]|uniref:FliM/FliN family flagellar motor C-terminal domain-containing protein n=1 Tax=Dyella silvatica TaxID=2992128 RepID=UPI002254E6EA|nr:FliM/FliN family flagellar motor C-terminal domain-containing protein [Dyella silvatica]